ncbi:major facilitator superfamily domain-containing protein 9 isoform X2 [Xenopus laevis]|nr:major facilitator superfamily domain-containing protein 9 isoform X2 [Xenopus laevis]
MIVPLLNHHIKSLGASPTTAGIIGSCYGVLQLFSSSIVGSWSDIVGRRFSLITCILVSAFGYALLGLSTNIFICALARIPVGIFKHSLSISKALLSDLVLEKERPRVMGRFNAASSMGFILGPVVAGYLTELQGGFYLTCFLCSAIFVLNAGLVWIMPSSEEFCNGNIVNENKTNDLTPDSHVKLDVLQENKEIIKNHPTWTVRDKVVSVFKKVTGAAFSDMWDIFLVRLLMAISVMLCYSNFALAMEERFHMKPRTTGYLISYSSSLGVVAGFLMGTLSKLYEHSSYTMLMHASILTFFCIFTYSLASKIWVVVLSFTFLAFSTNIGRTCIVDIELTVGKQYGSGTLIGIGQSVSSVGRILAPLLSGFAQEYDACGPPLLGAIMALASIYLMYKCRIRYTGASLQKRKSE